MMRGVVLAVLALSTVPFLPAPVAAEDTSAKRCSAAELYCVEVTLSDVTFSCSEHDDDTFTCDLAGSLTVTATGPQGVPGWGRFYAFLELGLCGECTQLWEEPVGTCTWASTGVCTMESTFHLHGRDVPYDGCAFGWGYLWIEAMSRPLHLPVNAARVTFGHDAGWYQGVGC